MHVDMNYQKKDLLGFLIGDSYISPKGCLTTRHSYKQKDYLEYKYNLCKYLYPNKNFNICDVPSQSGFQFGLSDAKLFKEWRKIYYPNGIKTISKVWLNSLTYNAIAFWFCDDGSTSFKRRNGDNIAIECTISTCCTETEADEVILYFKEKWNLHMTKKKDHKWFSVRFGTKTGRKFVNLFGEYIPPCMNYKISKFDNFVGSYITN